jgi:hypothetical protein
MGCQWCQVHKDRLSPISTPYCADQRLCYGGIEEAATPYGDEIRGLYNNLITGLWLKKIVEQKPSITYSFYGMSYAHR